MQNRFIGLATLLLLCQLSPVPIHAGEKTGVRMKVWDALRSSSSLLAERISRSKGVFGIGVVLGEPSGISGKYWLSENTAVDGAFGYSFGDRFRFSLDYLTHIDAFESPDFLLYYGIGGALSGDRGYVTKSRGGDFALGVRGVIGIDYLFRRAPLDAFLEVAPIMFVAPPFGISIDFCFGIRVYP